MIPAGCPALCPIVLGTVVDLAYALCITIIILHALKIGQSNTYVRIDVFIMLMQHLQQRNVHIYTAIYNVHMRFWQTLHC
jgi:diacylglycerol kinase family enzyme